MVSKPKERDVGIGEVRVSHNPEVLRIVGLGSCVAVALYDPIARVGGLAHVMLPRRRVSIFCDANGGVDGRFAEDAVRLLLDEMLKAGAEKGRVVAKVAGGACMFPETMTVSIGEENVRAVKEALRNMGVRLIAEDTGGNHGRTVILDTCTGKMTVKTMHGDKIL
ncbi:chemotaxis protein CheD [Candidatus Alkanophaga liquidiphilum]|nr:Chemotaxis receptorglutamine deamidase CheD [Candidatus Alkanophaga liquidiphilum]RLG37623.1 MAG: chemotaxis protein CheD [Candidatus Alkanophagales archaeon]